jgi:uncharacterized protein YndB with AHSA1/START domain
MEIERSVEISRPRAEVFDFVADVRNDPLWCPKVRSVEQLASEPGEGSRFAVVHKPVPGRPARRLEMTCVEFSPPARLRWREEDGTDVFEVTYSLEAVGVDASQMTQRSVATLGAPRLLQPLFKLGIGRDLAKQLRLLKELLEEPDYQR